MTETGQQVLIVGGGVSGLNAASFLARRGVAVHLVEKKEKLGGHAAEWACMATDSCEYCAACLAAESAHQAVQGERTTVYLQSRVTRLEKSGTGYRATIEGKAPAEVDVQAVLLATGFDLFDPARLEYLEQDSERVVTTADVNRLLREEKLSDLLPEDGAPSVAFIQCVGSRNRELGNDYCSQVCCKTSLRQANKILHRYPKAQVTIFHIDLQTIGKLVRTQTNRYPGRLTLQQGVPSKIFSGRGEDKLTVIKEDAATGSRVAADFDMVVLAVGMQAAEDTAALLKGVDGKSDRWGFLSGDTSSLPKGIFTAGAAAGPTDILTARSQGEVAAKEILQMLEVDEPEEQKPSLAIVGKGEEGVWAAQALSGFGYPVALIDSGFQKDIPESIKYYAHAKPVSVSGTAGAFHIVVEDPTERHSLNAAAVILANGMESRPFASKDLENSAGLLSPLSAFAALAAGSAGELPGAIAFWLDHAGPEWKKQSRQALELAKSLADQGKNVSVLAEKMLVHGLNGQRMYDEARKAGVKFLRVASSRDVSLSTKESQAIVEFTEATLPDIRLQIACDCLVVPEKVSPSADNGFLADVFRQETDAEGFLQSANARHRHIGSPRRGVFFIGSCHDEADEQDLKRELLTLKASLDRLSDPTAGQDPPAEIEKPKCVRCLTCIRVCPHGAVVLENNYQPVIAPQACFGCGLCVSSCPAKAIRQETAEEADSGKELSRKTVVFVCDRSAHLAAKEMLADGNDLLEDAVFVSIPCASSLSVETMLQPLVKGARKVLVAACHKGNCRSMIGSEYAAARVERIRTDLKLSADRLDCRYVAANEPAGMKQLLTSTPTAGKEAEND